MLVIAQARSHGGGELRDLSYALNLMLDKLLSTDQLERENAFRKELIESLPGIFYMLDTEGRLVMWNRNLELVLKCEPEELLNRSTLDFFRGEHKVDIERAMILARGGELSAGHLDFGRRAAPAAATPALGTIAVIVRQEIVLGIMGGIFVAEVLSVGNSLEIVKDIGDADLDGLVDGAAKVTRLLDNNPRPMTREDLRTIYAGLI